MCCNPREAERDGCTEAGTGKTLYEYVAAGCYLVQSFLGDLEHMDLGRMHHDHSPAALTGTLSVQVR